MRILEYRVARRVAGLEFFLNLDGQIIGSILRFPPASREPELVANGTVWNDAFAAGMRGEFGNKRPTAPFCGFIE